MYQGIRLRNGAKIRELKIPEEDLKQVKEIMSSAYTSPYRRRELSKSIVGTSLCCVCYGIPSVELIYDVSDHDLKATKVERYCDSCFRQVYARIEAGEPSDNAAVAEYYGCVKMKAEEMPRSPPEPYIKSRKSKS